MKTIELDIELADNGAIIRWFDDEGHSHVEVSEGRADSAARFIGTYIIAQMNYDVKHKAKVKIEYGNEDEI